MAECLVARNEFNRDYWQARCLQISPASGGKASICAERTRRQKQTGARSIKSLIAERHPAYKNEPWKHSNSPLRDSAKAPSDTRSSTSARGTAVCRRLRRMLESLGDERSRPAGFATERHSSQEAAMTTNLLTVRLGCSVLQLENRSFCSPFVASESCDLGGRDFAIWAKSEK